MKINEEMIELKDCVIGVDYSNGKDVGILTKMKREKGDTFSIEKVWQIVKQLETQAEVDALPSESKVVILWSGGNGPHEYEIAKFGHSTFVMDPVMKKINFGAGPIDFVGTGRMHTKVWLLES